MIENGEARTEQRESSAENRLHLLLGVVAAASAIAVVLLTPYSLRLSGVGMLHPYDPPPLSALAPLREGMIALLPALPGLSLLGAALLSAMAAAWFYRAGKPISALHTAGFIVSLGLAACGQVTALNGDYSQAGLFYLMAAVGFCAWVVLNRERVGAALEPIRVPRRLEITALILVMLLAFGARFFELRRIPYGIEGDEAKWTVEVVGVMVDSRHVLASDWHYGGVPGSFYMQAPFHLVLGPSLLSARIAVACYSVLATFIYYWFVRDLFNVPVALLATGFMSVSLIDLSASRLALVEGYTKLWVIVAPALLMLALRHRRWWLFALAGGAFGLGIVTYDLYLPMLAVGGAIFVVEMLYCWREGGSARGWLGRWAVFLLTLGVFLGRALLYIGGRGEDYRLEDIGWVERPVDTFLLGLGRVLRSFAYQVDRDFLHTREGPIINSLLVPLLVLGVMGCLVFWRRRQARVPLVWAALALFPAQIVLLVAYPRALYPALPALYILAALGAFWLLRALWGWSGRLARRALLVGVGVGVIVYPLLNLHIYFNEVHEAAERIEYRELSDFLLHYAKEGRLVLVPYMPLRGDLVEASEPWFDFYLRQNLAEGTQGRFYRLVTYDDLFVALTQAFDEYQSVAVLVDRNVGQMETRAAIIEDIHRCYRTRVVWSRRYAYLMLFLKEDQQNASCYSARVILTPGELQPSYLTQDPPLLYWSVSNGTPLQAALECQRQRDDVYFVEAEDFGESQFYAFRDDIVSGASGRGVIADEPGDGIPLASTTLHIPRSGRYYVWARTYRVREDDYPLYFSIADYPEPVPFSVNPPLGTWQWEQVGDFELPTEPVYLAVTRPYEGEKPFAVYLDAIVVTADGAYTPVEAEGRWNAYLPGNPIDLAVPGLQQGVFRLGDWEAGTYRCRVGVWDGLRLRASDGQAGVWSSWINLAFVASEEALSEGDQAFRR